VIAIFIEVSQGEEIREDDQQRVEYSKLNSDDFQRKC
jgi:hypothetical protein